MARLLLGYFKQRPEINFHGFGDAQQSIKRWPALLVFHAANHRMRQAGAFGDSIHGKAFSHPLLTEQADDRGTDDFRLGLGHTIAIT